MDGRRMGAGWTASVCTDRTGRFMQGKGSDDDAIMSRRCSQRISP
jgi:hypothetical protein